MVVVTIIIIHNNIWLYKYYILLHTTVPFVFVLCTCTDNNTLTMEWQARVGVMPHMIKVFYVDLYRTFGILLSGIN